jgi:hypothetical protein
MEEEKCWICRSEERTPILDIRTQATIGFKTVKKKAQLVKVIVKCMTNGKEWYMPIMKCVDCIAFTKQLELYKEPGEEDDDAENGDSEAEEQIRDNAEADIARMVGALPALRKEEKDAGQ